MAFNLKPEINQVNWGQALNDYLDSVEGEVNDKETPAGAQAKASAAQSAANAYTDGEMGALPATYAPLNNPTRHAPAFGLYFPEAEGAIGDGVADDTVAVQAAIDAANAAGGGTAHCEGNHAVAGTLTARDNTTVYLGPKARLTRTVSGGPLISNADFAVKVNGFKITGPGTIGAASHAVTGQTIFLHGDDINLSGFTIDTYAGGQALLIGGDRNRLDHLTIVNPEDAAGCGGIRMYGGSDFVATACHVVAGDDTFQFTPVATDGHVLRDMSISDAAYIGCTGGSTQARFMVAVLSSSPPGAGTLTNSISNVSFIGCHGFGGKRGIVIANTDSTGEIANVGIIDCSVNMTGAIAGGGQDVRIERTVGSGRVRDIRFSGFRIINPVETAVGTSGDAVGGVYVENVVLQDCILEAPANGGATLTPLSIDGLTVRGGRIEGAGTARPIEGGTAINASRRVNIFGTVITGIGDGWAGVRLPETVGYRVRDVHFEPLAGSTTAEGVSLAGGSSGGVIVGNDFTDLPGVGVTGTIAAGTIIRDNLGYETEVAGAATIAGAATSKAITHGLPTTPTAVMVGKRTDEDIWVSARNAITFTVTRAVATGTPLDFDWSATYRP